MSANLPRQRGLARPSLVHRLGWLLLALQAACAAPLQNGDAVIAGGISERLEAMCRYKSGASAKQVSDICGETALPERAKVALLTEAECARGDCRAGDVLLENRVVRVVVAGSAFTFGGVERPAGAILSASLRGGGVATESVSLAPNAAWGDVPLRLDVGRALTDVADSGSAYLTIPFKGVTGAVRYELPAELPVLQLTTAIEPPADHARPLLLDHFALPGQHDLTSFGKAWLFARDDVSMAYVELGKQSSKRSWSAGREGQWKLSPTVRAGKLVWRRALALTEGGSLAPAAAAASLSGSGSGRLELALDSDWTQPPSGTRIQLRRDQTTLWAPVERGRAHYDVPAGPWHVLLASGAHRSSAEPVRVEEDVTPSLRFTLPTPPLASVGPE